MLSLHSEIRFWSLQDDINIRPSDYGAFKYNIRKDPSVLIYQNVKHTYAEQRGLKYVIINKRPHKLRDKIKDLEEALVQNKIIFQTWQEDTLKLLLSRGLIVTIKTHSTDIASITFDRNLLNRIQNEIISDGIIVGNQVVCICKDGKVYGQGGLWKEWVLESGSRRNLSMHGEFLAVWGKIGTEHPQPWSPMAKDHQRANLHLYWIGARGPDLVAYRKTDGEPIKIIVSKVCNKNIIVVEQKVSQRGAVSIEVCTFELIGTSLKRICVTSVPLQTQVSCVSLSGKENYLILGCIDGSLALLDRNRGSSRIIKAAFIPTNVAWHKSEALATIANERGQLQYYDTALNCIPTQTISEDPCASNVFDISSYFTTQNSVEMLFWGSRNMLVALEQGPLIVVSHNKMNFLNLIQIYLNENNIDKAIRLLLSKNFNEEAFGALQRIVAHLLRKPLNETTAKQLQDALGSYHCPPVPLNADARHHFGPQVKSMTRRFFHQLVRSKMFETAFLLAVDLGYHDLFMDLHYIAVRTGETEMAAAARAQASALLSHCSSEDSNCSRSSCSQCSDSCSETSEESENNDENRHMSQENYLSTNFNNPIPKTYRPASYVPPIPNVDLPKIRLMNKQSMPPPPTIQVPPLPLTPALLPYGEHSTLGIPYTPRLINPYIQHKFTPIKPPMVPPPPIKPAMVPPPPIKPPMVPPPLMKQSMVPPPTIKPPMAPPPLRPPPPLPVTPPINVSTTAQNPKKPQAKVKFSDTVTAFIVPEVKRPVRVPPPAHVMNPQKELADSLPLCHPNEDYLKDFTPIQRESSESPPMQQPKIKVVHFGVV
ncbi:PREDICTED: WD repeat-containing and planar cell polarity effector protein fritz [Nicrophorus vespilloides]|uniref:WD repeat-containing and planar cell polarity effector protein fritz n=1 Tax=Nicrophorus vespilloides TaxID=110193 RepID=A0ABM1NC09_NICVS|nr:PREDICTED: WD repeat-containing and planar cell polarity effector protein fritz [Nicrophorus vespilloides]